MSLDLNLLLGQIEEQRKSLLEQVKDLAYTQNAIERMEARFVTCRDCKDSPVFRGAGSRNDHKAS